MSIYNRLSQRYGQLSQSPTNPFPFQNNEISVFSIFRAYFIYLSALNLFKMPLLGRQVTNVPLRFSYSQYILTVCTVRAKSVSAWLSDPELYYLRNHFRVIKKRLLKIH